MNESTTHNEFFGDGLKAFCLTVPMIFELERSTGRGIGGLIKSIFASDFAAREIFETIRLGLIGGGTDPEEAYNLVHAYAHTRSMMANYSLALSILEALMMGIQSEDPAAPEEPASVVQHVALEGEADGEE